MNVEHIVLLKDGMYSCVGVRPRGFKGMRIVIHQSSPWSARRLHRSGTSCLRTWRRFGSGCWVFEQVLTFEMVCGA